MFIKFFKRKGGEIMTFIDIYALVKLGMRLVASVGKCIRAKKAAGEDVNLWDYLECTVEGLNPLESDLIDTVTDLQKHGKLKSKG